MYATSFFFRRPFPLTTISWSWSSSVIAGHSYRVSCNSPSKHFMKQCELLWSWILEPCDSAQHNSRMLYLPLPSSIKFRVYLNTWIYTLFRTTAIDKIHFKTIKTLDNVFLYAHFKFFAYFFSCLTQKEKTYSTTLIFSICLFLHVLT